MSDSTHESVALVFHERFWADHDAGGSKPLADYLALFPGHDHVISREYLQALALAGGGGDEGPRHAEKGQVGSYRLLRERRPWMPSCPHRRTKT
jgi:hypothetical protein